MKMNYKSNCNKQEKKKKMINQVKKMKRKIRIREKKIKKLIKHKYKRSNKSYCKIAQIKD